MNRPLERPLEQKLTKNDFFCKNLSFDSAYAPTIPIYWIIEPPCYSFLVLEIFKTRPDMDLLLSHQWKCGFYEAIIVAWGLYFPHHVNLFRPLLIHSRISCANIAQVLSHSSLHPYIVWNPRGWCFREDRDKRRDKQTDTYRKYRRKKDRCMVLYVI